MLLPQQTKGVRRQMPFAESEHGTIYKDESLSGIQPSDNPPGVPADWKLCCGDDQYRKYVGPDNTNRCYEKQSDGTWSYTYGSRCDAHDHDCFVQVCTY